MENILLFVSLTFKSVLRRENDRGNNADVRKCLSNGTPNNGDDDSEMNKVSVAVESHRSTLFDKLAEICGIKLVILDVFPNYK